MKARDISSSAQARAHHGVRRSITAHFLAIFSDWMYVNEASPVTGMSAIDFIAGHLSPAQGH